MSRNGETTGPVDEATIRQWASEGLIVPGMMFRDEAGGMWTPVEQSPFAALVARPRTSAEAITRAVPTWLVIAAIPATIVVAALFAWVDFGGSSSSAPQPESKPAKKPAAQPAPPEPPSVMDRINATKTLEEVLPIIQPAMEDHHGSEISSAAAVLALWMAKRQPADVWASLKGMPDSKRTEIEKDTAPFRGKKLCTRGRIIQIFTDRSAGKPIYYGVLGAGWTGFIRFVAAGSTAGIVENSAARFCGVVVGVHSYDNRMGGSTSGVEVVGLFDLPVNKTAP